MWRVKEGLKIQPNMYIQPKVLTTKSGHRVHKEANLINDYGISGNLDKTDVHDNHPQGNTMWLVKDPAGKVEIQFDLQGNYPVGEMWIWNYNQFDPEKPEADYPAWGLKQIRIYHSVDAVNWEELKGEGYPYILAKADRSPKLFATDLINGIPINFEGTTARYIKITAPAISGKGNWGGTEKEKNSFGLSKVRIYTGNGFAIIPEPIWTNLIHNFDGWTGGDGSFSVPMNGFDAPGGPVQDTTFLFGDTLIGSIDSVTDIRNSDFTMINNSYAIVKNSMPKKENVEYVWRQTDGRKPEYVHRYWRGNRQIRKI
ncbi:MAG: discoidin domain-containing protein [Clostridiales bacterium]|nr:discoidin domain-containing protein [Clostridiales bacterium]